MAFNMNESTSKFVKELQEYINDYDGTVEYEIYDGNDFIEFQYNDHRYILKLTPCINSDGYYENYTQFVLIEMYEEDIVRTNIIMAFQRALDIFWEFINNQIEEDYNHTSDPFYYENVIQNRIDILG